MNWYTLGMQEAMHKLGIANTHPLMKGVKVNPRAAVTGAPPPPPVARVWPAPPYATSGTTINPKVA